MLYLDQIAEDLRFVLNYLVEEHVELLAFG